MNLPFHVSSSEPAAPLFRLSDGRFHLTKDGPLAHFMSGWRYFLMEEDLFSFLQNFDIPRISFKPAVIWNRRTNEEFSNYSNLQVEEFFDSRTMNELDLTGFRFYSFDNR